MYIHHCHTLVYKYNDSLQFDLTTEDIIFINEAIFLYNGLGGGGNGWSFCTANWYESG